MVARLFVPVAALRPKPTAACLRQKTAASAAHDDGISTAANIKAKGDDASTRVVLGRPFPSPRMPPLLTSASPT